MRAHFEVDYGPHQIEEWWEDTDLHCPRCGEKKVWHENCEGDFYVGEMYLCIACGGSFTIQLGGFTASSDMQRLAELLAVDEEYNNVTARDLREWSGDDDYDYDGYE